MRLLVLAALLLTWPARAGTPATAHVLYVSNELSGDVSVIDGTQRVVTATIAVGKRPRGIHLTPDQRTLLVATSGSPRLGPGADPARARDVKADKSADGLALVDLAAQRLLRRLEVGSDPEEFALSADGARVFVANEDIAEASCWEIATGRRVFASQVSEEPEGVALHPTRDEVYITCEDRGEVFVLDAQSGRQIARFRVGGRPRSVAFTRDGALAFVPGESDSNVSIVDTRTHRVIGAVVIPGENMRPMSVQLSPDDRELYVSTGRGNTVAVIDVAGRKVAANIVVGERPWGIALSPDGSVLYSANGRSHDVSVVDVRARREVARIKAGQGPWGIAVRALAR